MNDTPDPAEALAAIHASRQAVHDRVATGSWRYDLIYAALAATMIGAQALDQPFAVLGTSVSIGGLASLFGWEARRTGVRLTGVSPRRARWVAIGLGLVFGAMMLGVVAVKNDLGLDLPLLPTALAAMAGAFAVALAGSRLWRRVYTAEMRGRL